MPSDEVRVARVYDASTPEDGARVLVDRLWPRGLSKGAAALDEWLKEVAPSTELRRWYGHDPERFEEFEQRYRAELEKGAAADALATLRERRSDGTLTLLTATRDLALSHATVLAVTLRAGR
ncbi:MAG: DUF488 domain-containing protein [Acidimicrobiales bacterium]